MDRQAHDDASAYRNVSEPVAMAVRPRAYWIPPGWSDVAQRVGMHGIVVERLASPRTLEVEMDRITTARLDTLPYERHVRMKASFAPERQRRTFPPGSIRVPTDQPLGDLAVLLLDPHAPWPPTLLSPPARPRGSTGSTAKRLSTTRRPASIRSPASRERYGWRYWPSLRSRPRFSISFFSTSRSRTLNSTRRFWALPASVLLSATGWVSP